MKNIKRYIAKIPVLGYLLKLLSALVLLPRHLTRQYNQLEKHSKKIDELESTVYRANVELIKQKEMLQKLKSR